MTLPILQGMTGRMTSGSSHRARNLIPSPDRQLPGNNVRDGALSPIGKFFEGKVKQKIERMTKQIFAESSLFSNKKTGYV